MIFDMNGEMVTNDEMDKKSIKYIEQLIQETVEYLDLKIEDFTVSQSLYDAVFNLFGITKNQLNQIVNIVKSGERLNVVSDIEYTEEYKELQKAILNEMKIYFLQKEPLEEK